MIGIKKLANYLINTDFYGLDMDEYIEHMDPRWPYICPPYFWWAQKAKMEQKTWK